MNTRLTKVVLASRSPQRLALLRQILPYTEIVVRPTGIEEQRFHELGPVLRCKELARAKIDMASEHYGKDCETAVLIAADTEVIVRNIALGKPTCVFEAKAMLKSLRGGAHEVVTGLSVFDSLSGKSEERVVSTTVYFRNFCDDVLDSYLRTNEWKGKSGGYALQGFGVVLTSEIHGSYSNVVGLPLEELGEIFTKEFNYEIW
ncbi:MAG: Maf family protein [Nitrosomonas sp.]|uniref:Maf family protein n=1 Tax=Nitrosomonas sp. TaxID=42353 RepID=UPI00273729D0|nr:Maf family protein [Nitrosomonas sp.]MDP3279605.1 Maf family protein [Nitrosomonas sp.]MDP3662725.1 Maf family protein [Nitrosomonas sp.]MDZ4106331.1 Maf family protein [Nitrosomonas sp.]